MSRVAVALRATTESENASSIHRRTECDGYPAYCKVTTPLSRISSDAEPTFKSIWPGSATH